MRRCINIVCHLGTHNVPTTSLQRRCNVVTLQRRCNDVVATLYVCWAVTFTISQGLLKKQLTRLFLFVFNIFYFFFISAHFIFRTAPGQLNIRLRSQAAFRKSKRSRTYDIPLLQFEKIKTLYVWALT